MATSISASPRGVQVTVGVAAVTLLSLLRAIDSGCPQKCCFLQLQADIVNGGNIVFMGNSDVNTTTMYGSEIQAGSALPVLAFDSNLIDLGSIYVIASAAAQKLNVLYLTR